MSRRRMGFPMALGVIFPMTMGGNIAGTCTGHGGIRIPNSSQISQPRADIQVFKEGIILWQGTELSDFGRLIQKIAEDDGLRRASLLAGSFQSSGWNF